MCDLFDCWGDMGRLTSGEACVKSIGKIPKIQGHMRSGLVEGVGDHAEIVCDGGVRDENRGLF